MAQVSVVGPDGGEPVQLGPTRMRILETARPPGTARVSGRSPWPRVPAGRRSTGTPGHDEGFYVVSARLRHADRPAGTRNDEGEFS